jgi:hypothetical protein
MSTQRNKRRFDSNKLLDSLNLNVQTSKILKSLINKGSFKISKTEVSLDVPAAKRKRAVLPTHFKSKEEKKQFKKYISTSHIKRKGMKNEKEIPSHTVTKQINVLKINLDTLDDPEDRLIIYDYFVSQSEEPTMYHVQNQHLYAFIHLVSELIKDKTKPLFLKSLNFLYWLRMATQEMNHQSVEVETVNIEEVDEARIDLAIAMEVKKALNDPQHPLFNKVMNIIDRQQITEDTVNELASKFKVKQKGTDEIL